MDNKQVKSAVEQIPVPKEKVFSAISEGLNQARPKKKRKVATGLTAAVALVGITLGSGFVNPTMNSVLASAPLIGGIFQQFNDKTGMELAHQQAVTELDQSMTKNGVTVKLTSAYFDGVAVSITGFVDDGVEKGQNEPGEVSFDVNYGDGQGDRDAWLSDRSSTVKKVKGGYDFQWKMNYPYETIDDNEILPVTIHSINGVKGEWTFDVPLQQEEITRTALDQSHESKQDGVSFHLKEILTGKASSSLVYETVQKYKDDDVRIKKARDEDGKVYGFGNPTVLSESQEEDGYHRTLRVEMTKPASAIDSLTFYPQVDVADPKVEQLLDQDRFTLESDRLGMKLKVNNVAEHGDQVVMDYQLLGLPADMSEDRLELLENNLQYELLLVDQDYLDKIDPDNPVPPKHHSIRKNTVKMIDGETAHFQSTFELDGEEPFKDFTLENTVLQFDFSSFVSAKELKPFDIYVNN
ncbi:DUF4179 domain-containing protein [Rossellomorea marisflavi]|uniref:DUF4179 domain-containing protein n=1 Tax=Rossellomorea marisflavi TaxID=189381 RepID=UPI002079BE90|nr:DUF4179 domain-containing protein [Rossellomorea marisflavi]USK92873.1 DUF4179 domain-containing protein [Rossellomorea marisflavi]